MHLLNHEAIETAIPLLASDTRRVTTPAPATETLAPTRATTSWVLRDKNTGRVIAETFDRKKVDTLNTDRYEAVPVIEHLHQINTPGTLAYRVAREPQQSPADPVFRPARARGTLGTVAQAGKVGGTLFEGEVVLTATGRPTTPFPKIDFGSERKSINTVRRGETWLMQNALDEAKARRDDFNARWLEQALHRPSQSDKDCAEEYLFGKQPPTMPTLTSPLSAYDTSGAHA